jgi:thiamine biosynthesis protein ThiI
MKGLLLLSGGIDSPVAGYLMAKRGLEIGAVHFTMYPYSRREQEEKSSQLAAKLSKLTGSKLSLYSVDIGKAHSLFLTSCNRRFQCLLCKRTMYRVAEAIALSHGYDCLVTGDNLGQVASQTLDNMAVIDSAVKMPVLRPLLCNDKMETTRVAKEIGTYDISIIPGDCCSLAPDNPITRGKNAEISKQEDTLEIPALVQELADSAKITECC